MVGGRGVQRARLEAAPQRFLVLLGAEGRAHHVGGGRRPIGMAIDAVVDQQVTGEHFAEHALALAAGARDRLQRLAAGIVHDVERHAEHLGDADRAVGRFPLDLRRARQRMRLGAREAGLQKLLLEVGDQFAVLGMHGAQRAQLARPREAVHQHRIVGHDRALVGHEMLEAVDAVVARQRAHVAMHAVVPPRHRDVERIVAGRLGRPAAPFGVGVEQRFPRRRDDEIDDRRRAAGEAGRGTGVEIVGRDGAHEGQLHMRVRIDAAGHDQAVAGIDDCGAGRRLEAGADRPDRALGAQHVAAEAALGGDHRSAPDQRRHRSLLSACRVYPAPSRSAATAAR